MTQPSAAGGGPCVEGEDGSPLAESGGEAGQGAGPAGGLGRAFQPGHGREADSGLSGELFLGQAVLAA